VWYPREEHQGLAVKITKRISSRYGTQDNFWIFDLMRRKHERYWGRGVEDHLRYRTERVRRIKFKGRMLRISFATWNPGNRLPDSWWLTISFWKKHWKPSQIFMQGDGKGGLKFTTISENGASEINLSPESTKQLTDRL
jgi:hypothetical protein